MARFQQRAFHQRGAIGGCTANVIVIRGPGRREVTIHESPFPLTSSLYRKPPSLSFFRQVNICQQPSVAADSHPRHIAMAIEKRINEVPDSEEEPLSSSPEAPPDDACVQLDGAADEQPRKTSPPGAGGSLVKSEEDDDEDKVTKSPQALRDDNHQAMPSDTGPLETIKQANAQSNAFQQHVHGLKSSSDYACVFVTDTCNSSDQQSSVPPTEPASLQTVYNEQGHTPGLIPNTLGNTSDAVNDESASIWTEDQLKALHVEKGPDPQQEETLPLHQTCEAGNLQCFEDAKENAHEDDNHSRVEMGRGASCPPESNPQNGSYPKSGHALKRFITTDGTYRDGQTKQHTNSEDLESLIQLSPVKKTFVQPDRPPKIDEEPEVPCNEDSGKAMSDVAIVKPIDPEIPNATVIRKTDSDQQTIGDRKEDIADHHRTKADAPPTPNSHCATEVPIVREATNGDNTVNIPAVSLGTDDQSPQNTDPTIGDNIPTSGSSVAPPKTLCGEPSVRVEERFDTPKGHEGTESETSKEPQVASSATIATAEVLPTPAKSAQEVLLAELTAQRAALIASLGVLPSIQKLVAEAETSGSALQATGREPTENEVMAAAHRINKKHIKLLHEYNELKDIGQGMMGLIADQRGVRIVEVQDEFGIDSQD